MAGASQRTASRRNIRVRLAAEISAGSNGVLQHVKSAEFRHPRKRQGVLNLRSFPTASSDVRKTPSSGQITHFFGLIDAQQCTYARGSHG